MIGQKFATPKLDFWCAPPENSTFEHYDVSIWRAISSPRANGNVKQPEDDVDIEYDRCQIFDVNYNDENILSTINRKLWFIH